MVSRWGVLPTYAVVPPSVVALRGPCAWYLGMDSCLTHPHHFSARELLEDSGG